MLLYVGFDLYFPTNKYFLENSIGPVNMVDVYASRIYREFYGINESVKEDVHTVYCWKDR